MASSIHPSDRIYALEVAVRLAEQTKEASNVISDLKVMLDEARREARGE